MGEKIKPIAKFVTKSGKAIEIHLPTLDRVLALLEFVNRLVKEDTFLSLSGQPKTYQEEEMWTKNAIVNMKAGRSFVCWAIYNGKIIGSSDVNRGYSTRDFHVGRIGLMVDKDFRQDGIGKFLLNYVLTQAKKMNLKIVSLDLFDENEIAKKLYQKMDFKEYGRLPQGLFRQKKYSNKIEMYKEL